MRRKFLIYLVGTAGAIGSVAAQAQSCTASASPLDFGGISPIRLSAVDASGSIRVTCTWPTVSVNRNARICLNLGQGTASSSFVPRHLVDGNNNSLRFNLYQDGARARVWGSVYASAANSPLTLVLSKPFAGTTASATIPYFGRIEANQPGVPVVGSGPTTYANAFTGAHTTLNTHFFDFIDRSCAEITRTSASFPFQVTAQVVNDCTISASDLNFPATGVLNRPIQGVGGLNVRCTNGNAWRIALSGGSSGNALGRRMQRVGGAGSVAYQLYTSSSRSVVWGDGSAGTARVTATGTGMTQNVQIFGTVPAQTTPPPGTYRDTITATISF